MIRQYSSKRCRACILLIPLFGCGQEYLPSQQSGAQYASHPAGRHPHSFGARIDLNELFGVREGQAPNQLLRDWLTDYQEDLTHYPEVFFHGANAVEVRTARPTDEFLSRLNSSKVQWLRIAHRDELLGHTWIGRLPTLRGVSFCTDVNVSSADLETLAMLPELRWLNLRDTEMSSDTFSKIPALPKLETLHLSGKLVTDANIEVLSRFPNLRTVALERSLVTDAGVASLKNLSDRLECLDLYGCRSVSKQSLGVLSTFPKLNYVALGLTQLSIQVDVAQVTESLKPAYVDLGN